VGGGGGGGGHAVLECGCSGVMLGWEPGEN
jgi:hypothetical protein